MLQLSSEYWTAWMFGIQMVKSFKYRTFCTINWLFQSSFQTTIQILDHSNTRLVQYSDGYCTLI